MIDPAEESLLTLSEAAELLPGRPHRCTLHRWARGVSGGVRLETLLVGGRRCTSREAVQRFIRALNGITEPHNEHLAGVAS